MKALPFGRGPETVGRGEDYGWDYPPGVTESDIDDEGWEEEEREEEPDEDALIEEWLERRDS